MTADWDASLKRLVGEVILMQRSGYDVLASSAWDDVGRHWESMENDNAAVLCRPAGKGPWQCFHCDEKFYSAEEAEAHFGPTQHSRAVCQTEAEHIRQLEKELQEYREENTPLLREIRVMKSDHQVALRRMEELGYARGLRDANHIEPE